MAILAEEGFEANVIFPISALEEGGVSSRPLKMLSNLLCIYSTVLGGNGEWKITVEGEGLRQSKEMDRERDKEGLAGGCESMLEVRSMRNNQKAADLGANKNGRVIRKHCQIVAKRKEGGRKGCGLWCGGSSLMYGVGSSCTSVN